MAASSCLLWLCMIFQIQTLLATSGTENIYKGMTSDVSNTTVMFVNASSGEDSSSCGQKMAPCKTVQFALDRSLQMDIPAVLIRVSEGIYSGGALRADCSAGRLESIVIQGPQDQEALMSFSVDAVKCNLTFINLHWGRNKLSIPVLMNAIISTLSLHQCTFSSIPFSMISTGSNIYFTDSTISNCSGWQPSLPLISAASVVGFPTSLHISQSGFSKNYGPILSSQNLDYFTIQRTSFMENSAQFDNFIILSSAKKCILRDSSFKRNVGTVVQITTSSMVDISGSVFEDNAVMSGSVIEAGGESIVLIEDTAFIRTHGLSMGPVVAMQNKMSKVNIESSFFGCNKVNDSTGISPVSSLTENQLECNNCTADPDCPVYCLGGYYLKDAVLCVTCLPGTFTSSNGYNNTAMACSKCPVGFFSAKAGSDSCTPCKEGTFAAKPGSTLCTPCKNDFFTSDKGQASCSIMTIGCLVLTICVVLLIVVPLALLMSQRKKNSSKSSSNWVFCAKRDRNYHRMLQPGDVNVIVSN